MSKLSYKTLLIIFFILSIGVVAIWKFVLPNRTKVSAAWWNDNWNYRQAINISSHTASESNVYIIATVSIGTTTKVQSDDGDFRFVTQSGDILPYYISSGTGTTSVTFHIQFNSFPSGAQTVYAYYGNSTVTNGFSASDFSTQASNYTIGSYSSEEAGGGPVAYWKFDEGVSSTTRDSSGNSNTGTITGATWSSEDQCINGNCLDFNGSGSPNIAVSTNNSLNFGTENFTISAWALNRDYTYPKSNFMIKKSVQCFTDGASNAGFDIGHGYVANGIDVCIRDTSNNVVRQNITFDSGYRPSQLINKWTHYTFVFSRSTNKILFYVNGVKQSYELNISSVTGSINNSSALILGTLYGWQTDGLYDEVKIYPYTRTAAQIKLDYNSRGSQNGSSVNLGIKSSTAPTLKSKLVAHWKFDENNGSIANNSGNGGIGLSGVFGTGNSAPTWTNNGKFNKALSFNGSTNYLTTSNSTNFYPGKVSFFSWVYPQAYANGVDYSIKDDNSYFFVLNGTGTQLSVQANLLISGTWRGRWSATKTIDPNKWSYIGFTYDGSLISFYINGELSGSFTPAVIGDLTVGSSPVIIGKRSSGSFFNGLIDEVKIYNTALTADEIKQDYNQGSATAFGTTNQTIGGTTTSLEYCIPGDTTYCASPIAEWNFEENTGTSAKDISGNNNTGTFGAGNSAPTWTVGKKNTGSGLNFDGVDDRVTLSSTINLIDSNNWTVSAWVKTNTAASSILSNSNGGPVVNDLRIANSKISYAHYSGSWLYEYGNKNIADNRWHYLTWVNHSNKTMDMYVDGVGDTLGVGSSQSTGPVDQIGRNWTASANAVIDQVRIYNYARTPAQIAYDYNKGGPSIWLKFDECQGLAAFDASGSGYTGSISIGPSGSQNTAGTCQIGTSAAWTNGASGKINSSLNFDGTDDYVRFPNTAIGLTKPFTMSSWFKTSTSFAYQPGIIALGYYPVVVMKTDGKIRAWWYNGVTYPGVESIKAYNDGLFHHATLTYDGTTAKLYIDGNLESSIVSIIYSIYDYFEIGLEKNAGNKIFNGQIDDARFYRYALTPNQVKQVYNGGAVNFQ